MAFLLYLFVLLLSAASVMFGLDLMNSPLPSTPNVPIGRNVHEAVSQPVQHKATRIAREADKPAAPLTGRALTPIYPASPGPSAPMVTNDETVASNVPTEAKAPPAEPAAAPAAPMQQGAVPQAAVPPEPQESQPSCDVQACSRAYHSFRVTDCTYQPSQGPRRLCEKSDNVTVAAGPVPRPAPKQQTAVHGLPRQRQAARTKASKDALAKAGPIARQRLSPGKPMPLHPPQSAGRRPAELSEVERIVLKMTRGRQQGDIAVIDSTGRVIVVRTGTVRAQAYREW